MCGMGGSVVSEGCALGEGAVMEEWQFNTLSQLEEVNDSFST